VVGWCYAQITNVALSLLTIRGFSICPSVELQHCFDIQVARTIALCAIVECDNMPEAAVCAMLAHVMGGEPTDYTTLLPAAGEPTMFTDLESK
jgi:hypothetical protein